MITLVYLFLQDSKVGWIPSGSVEKRFEHVDVIGAVLCSCRHASVSSTCGQIHHRFRRERRQLHFERMFHILRVGYPLQVL